MPVRRLRERRVRDESGAVAVFVVIMAVGLMAVAALGVDLGNTWARGRVVQKQTDVAALSAAHLLPKTAVNAGEIAREVAAYLNSNLVPGQVTVAPADLLDGDATNGHIRFLDASGAPCAVDCVQMEVLAPPAVVDYGLAGVMGEDGASVQRRATVQLSTELPPKEDVVPLWLPFGCGYGPVHADTSQGNPSSPPPTADPSAPPTPVPPSTVPIFPVGSHELRSTFNPFLVNLNERREIGFFYIYGAPSNTDKASLRFVRPDGSGYIETTAHSPSGRFGFQVPPFEIGPSGMVGATSITDVPGDWKVYAIVQGNGRHAVPTYSSNFVTVRVAGGPATDPDDVVETLPAAGSSIPVGCVGQDRGNFGQLLSPRRDTSGRSATMARNMAMGLDHTLAPFEWGTTPRTDSCAKNNGSNAIPGARLDNVSRDGNNCIIADSGNDGPAMYDGLISGVGSQPGRLDAANGGTVCPSRSDASIGGHAINNDVLSCYLRPGFTLADIAADTGATTEMLDPAVKDSPRFVWLPLVQATDRSEKGFQPMIDFVPAFITDENWTTAATAANGLDVNGNSIKDIQLFAFSKDALPIDERSPVTEYNPDYGRPVVHLVR